jgi:predicted  nucleic acid-binding Zn-ribbon protein
LWLGSRRERRKKMSTDYYAKAFKCFFNNHKSLNKTYEERESQFKDLQNKLQILMNDVDETRKLIEDMEWYEHKIPVLGNILEINHILNKAWNEYHIYT